MKKMVTAAVIGTGMVLATAACSSTSESVVPSSSAENINNVVYFGNPTADVQTLGDYVVSGTNTPADGKPFVDTVVLFAANIDNQGQAWSADPSSPILDIGDSNLGGPTSPTPTEPRDVSWIAPAVTTLHSKGIKVLLGILPNHQGTGWSCPGMSTTAQQGLATQIAATVNQYKFDGISIDDEYSECPKGNDLPGGDASVNYGIVSQLRSDTTYAGKLITKSVYADTFAFPPATSPPAPNNLAPLLDAAWTETYPSSYSDLSPYQQAGLKNSQLGLSASPSSSPKQVAQAVAQNGLGYMMVWQSDGSLTTQQRAAAYSQVVQGEFGNDSAAVTYQSSNSTAAKQ